MTLDEPLRSALISRLTAFGDDELILAQRDSEWTGFAPVLEEDIALSNLAQDELGHATAFYQIVEALDGESPDHKAFFRDAEQFLNVQMVARPKGDWAFTMLRQYLFDAYEHVLYRSLADSTYAPLSDVVIKFRNEELYHLRHSHVWVERLGLGTDESKQRMQAALDELWPLSHQLFVPMPVDQLLEEAGLIPSIPTLKPDWEAIVVPHLEACQLGMPADRPPFNETRGSHGEYLDELLAEMQVVARWDPGASW